MFEDIANFFQGIIDFFTMLFDMIFTFISDIIYVIKTLGEVVIHLPDYIGWLPSAAASILLVIFGIVVVYKIMGREG